MSDRYGAEDEDSSYGYLDRVREDLDIYTGLAIGAGLQTAQWLTGIPLFEDHMNPWSGDKGAHAVFCYGEQGGTSRLSETISGWTEDTAVEPYTEPLKDQRYRTGLGLGVVGVFTISKEFLMDQNPDGYDMAANYLGASARILKEHHDIDSWTEEGKELGQRLYDGVRSE